MKKKVKKFANGGPTGLSISPYPPFGAAGSGNSGGLRGIIDTASGLVNEVSGFGDKIISGGQGGIGGRPDIISPGPRPIPMDLQAKPYKKGGKVKASSASKRADGIATKGKTRGRMI